MATLYPKYDYYGFLSASLPILNEKSSALYRPLINTLQNRIEDLLLKSNLITNNTIRVFDNNWDTKTAEEHSQNYKDFGKIEKTATLDFDDQDLTDDIDDGMDWLTTFADAPALLINNTETSIREELKAYSDLLSHLFGVERQVEQSISIQEIELQDPSAEVKRISKIKEKLVPIKGNLSDEDFEILISAIIRFFDTEKFPVLAKPLEVFDCSNKKQFGWAINRVFYYYNYPISEELLKFVKNYISVFKDVRMDLTDRKRCLVYKYLTEKPLKKQNP